MTSLAPLPMTIRAHVSWSKGRNSEGSSRLVAVATGRRGGSVVRGPRWCAAELQSGPGRAAPAAGAVASSNAFAAAALLHAAAHELVSSHRRNGEDAASRFVAE